MLNTKFIKIIIAIAVVLLLVFIFLFMKNNNSTTIPKEDNITPTQTGNDGRPALNTNTGTSSTQSSIDNYSNVDTGTYEGSGPEDILGKKVGKILSDWNITKDEKYLREAVALSENADNEAILAAWIPFMGTNSAELVKIINTSTDTKKTKSIITNIFQWYMELSGE